MPYFPDCTVSGVRGRGKKGRMYRVKHGETYFDSANCRTCQCNDGNATYYCRQVQQSTIRHLYFTFLLYGFVVK